MKAEAERGSLSMLSALGFGSIYPRLKQLEEAGLVETQQVETEGRRKKVYELTADGWRELGRWLEEPPGYPLPFRDDLLMKMLFWGSAGADRTALIEHLRARRDESLEVLDYLAEWQANETAFIDEYSLLVLTYIKTRLEAEISWIALAIAQLEGPPELPLRDKQWLAVLQKARRSKALDQEADT
jgi:DNA-binding PadR family transcriptional regulator